MCECEYGQCQAQRPPDQEVAGDDDWLRLRATLQCAIWAETVQGNTVTVC